MNWIDRKVEDYGLSSAYAQYIMADWRTCLWNPTRYLNIWLTKISTRSSEFPLVRYWEVITVSWKPTVTIMFI